MAAGSKLCQRDPHFREIRARPARLSQQWARRVHRIVPARNRLNDVGLALQRLFKDSLRFTLTGHVLQFADDARLVRHNLFELSNPLLQPNCLRLSLRDGQLQSITRGCGRQDGGAAGQDCAAA